MLVPLYGFLEGDTMGLLILAHDDMTMDKVADLLRRSAKPRVIVEGEVRVMIEGKEVSQSLTVAQAGLGALGRVDVQKREVLQR